MAITPIEKLPDDPASKYKEARAQLIDDVLEIIAKDIPLCEVTSEAYTTNTMRDALKHAIHNAVYRWNNRPVAKKGQHHKVSADMFTITRRKDDDGAFHFYVQYDGEGRQ